jgi:hypothetical protein
MSFLVVSPSHTIFAIPASGRSWSERSDPQTTKALATTSSNTFSKTGIVFSGSSYNSVTAARQTWRRFYVLYSWQFDTQFISVSVSKEWRTTPQNVFWLKQCSNVYPTQMNCLNMPFSNKSAGARVPPRNEGGQRPRGIGRICLI